MPPRAKGTNRDDRCQHCSRVPARPADAGLLRGPPVPGDWQFLSRDFQDNIDAFEQLVEPRLGVTRERASLSMAILTQLVTAAIAMIVGFTVFRDRAWSIYEVLEATLSLVLIIIIFNRLLPFVFFSRTRGRWLARWTPL